MVRPDASFHANSVKEMFFFRYHPNIELADKMNVYFPDGTWCATVNGVDHFCL